MESITGHRISRIEIRNDSVTTGFYEFIYHRGKLTQVLKYIVDSDTINDVHRNRNIKYKRNKIEKEFYSTYRDGFHMDLYVYNELTEFLLENRKVIEISNKSKLETETDWGSPRIRRYEYSYDRLTGINHYYGSIFERYDEFIYDSDSIVKYNKYLIDFYNDTTWIEGQIKYNNELIDEVIFIYHYNHPHDTILIEYSYDSNNQLIFAVENSNFGIRNTYYEYNSDGNLSKQIIGAREHIYTYEKGRGNAEIIWHKPEDYIYIRPSDINLITD